MPAGEAECPVCRAWRGTKILPRDTTLLLMIGVLLLFFTVAGFAARSYHTKKESLGKEWFSRGVENLRGDRADTAIRDFRTALVYEPDSSQYRLYLAQALMRAGRFEESRTYLLNLWENEPGNGQVNLELARLAARRNDTAEAYRFYRNAIYGVWQTDPTARRRATRLELCEFLVKAGQKEEAQAELVALAADLPADAALHLHVAELFLKAEDYARAAREFQGVLKSDAGSVQALAGAGKAFFQMGDYARARRYLQQAVRRNPKDAETAQLHEVADLVIRGDPFDSRISTREKIRRALDAYQQASARLQACADSPGQPSSGGQNAAQLELLRARVEQQRPLMRASRLRRDPDQLITAMDVVFDIEERTAPICGAPTGKDLALLLIARKYRGATP